MHARSRALRGGREFIRRIVLPACIAGLMGLFFGGWAVLRAAPPPGPVAGTTYGCYLGTGNKICETGLGETCANCAKDCGRCPADEPPPNLVCDNDQVCEPENGEATYNCGDCPSVCGDDICAPHEVDTCSEDCPLDVTCGDGVCGAIESFATCPLDCDPPTRTPTATEVPTETATTQPPEETEEQATPIPASDTPTPPEPETPTPEEVIVSLATPTATLQPPDCEIVSVNEIPGAVVEEFVKQTQGYTAFSWMRCRVAPEEVCLPSDPVLGVGTDVLLEVSLLDCDAKGCKAIPATSADDDQFCLQAAIAENSPDCADGCAFARFAPETPEQPSLPPATVPIVFGVGAAALVLLLVLIFVRRRTGEEREEAGESDVTMG